MAFRLQQLHAEVFEDRALPSVSFLTIPANAPLTATVRYAEQGLLATLQTLTKQATTHAYSEQGFGLVPLWLNRNGSMTFMIVSLGGTSSATEPITRGPVSQRESATASRTDSVDAPTDATTVVKNTARAAATNPNALISFNPELPTNTWRANTAHEQADGTPRFTLVPPTPNLAAAAPTSNAILRDYSTIAGPDVAPREPLTTEQPATPEDAAVEPSVPPPPTLEHIQPPTVLTVAELGATPLVGLLPFNVADLEAEAQDLLHRVANFGAAMAEEIAGSSESFWLTAAAIVAGGAAFASRPQRSNNRFATPGVLATWEDKNDGFSR